MMLITLLRDRTTIVWFTLIVATIASWTLGGGHKLSSNYVAISIIVISFAKVHLVGQYFMELRRAPRGLVAIFGTWNVAVAALLSGLYLFAS